MEEISPTPAETKGASVHSDPNHCQPRPDDWTGSYYRKVQVKPDTHRIGIEGNLRIPTFIPDENRRSYLNDPYGGHYLDAASAYFGLSGPHCKASLDTGLSYGPVPLGNDLIFVDRSKPAQWRDPTQQYLMTTKGELWTRQPRNLVATGNQVPGYLKVHHLDKLWAYNPFARYPGPGHDWDNKGDGVFFMPGENVSISLKKIGGPRSKRFELKVRTQSTLATSLKVNLPDFDPHQCAFKRVTSIDQTRKCPNGIEYGNERGNSKCGSNVIPTQAKIIDGAWTRVGVVSSYLDEGGNNIVVPLDPARADCIFGKDSWRNRGKIFPNTEIDPHTGAEEIEIHGIKP